MTGVSVPASVMRRQFRHSTWSSRLTRRTLSQRTQRERSPRAPGWQSGQISTWCSRTTPRCHGLGWPGSGSTWRVPHR
ncbi:MAG: hypothetical protein ACRDNW_25620 [Trebonia sp.]